jgi:DnaJ-class molecular chaperone
VLSDAEKRRLYDLYGAESLEGNGGGGGGGGGFNFHDPFDIFSQ